MRAGTGHWDCRKCGRALAGVRCECGSTRKYVGLIPHDFRRSAAKALRRAGVPESVIMEIGRWKTPSKFRRYAIVSPAGHRRAVEMLEQARAVEEPLSPRSAPSQQIDAFGEQPERRAFNENA